MDGNSKLTYPHIHNVDKRVEQPTLGRISAAKEVIHGSWEAVGPTPVIRIIQREGLRGAAGPGTSGQTEAPHWVLPLPVCPGSLPSGNLQSKETRERPG